ncbi:hypothetical protein EAF04_010182 [Stromatinia cepivora]|nr:hypothetical protein EAF04_010182 [Stromatinia cepivora]
MGDSWDQENLDSNLNGAFNTPNNNQAMNNGTGLGNQSFDQQQMIGYQPNFNLGNQPYNGNQVWNGSQSNNGYQPFNNPVPNIQPVFMPNFPAQPMLGMSQNYSGQSGPAMMPGHFQQQMWGIAQNFPGQSMLDMAPPRPVPVQPMYGGPSAPPAHRMWGAVAPPFAPPAQEVWGAAAPPQMWNGVAPADFGSPAALPAAPPAALPSRKRKVNSNACEGCNRKKIKCDREATNQQPPCAKCRQTGEECVMRKSARGGKRVKGQVKGVLPGDLPRGREDRGEDRREG